jgi:hypothetical protein
MAQAPTGRLQYGARVSTAGVLTSGQGGCSSDECAAAGRSGGAVLSCHLHCREGAAGGSAV